jgi:hypothetical protein
MYYTCTNILATYFIEYCSKYHDTSHVCLESER